MADSFRDQRSASQAKRKNNREHSLEVLRNAALKTSEHVEISEKNGGAHLIVEWGKNVVDFWPGTGRWIFRRYYGMGERTPQDSGPNGRGVFELLKMLGVKK